MAGLSHSSAVSVFSAKQNNKVDRGLFRSVNRVSSGARLTDASVDSASFSFSTFVNAERTSLMKAIENTNSGISMLLTADGTLSEMSNVLVRMRELAVQASTDTMQSTERNMVNTEYSQLFVELDRLAANSTFNGKSLLQSSDNEFVLQVGEQDTDSHRIKIDLTQLNSSTTNIGLAASNTISTIAAARSSFATLDSAISSIGNKRAFLGATINRLGTTSSGAEALQMAMGNTYSTMHDVDLAAESSQLAKFRIMRSANLSAMTQAKNIQRTNLSNLLAQI